MKRLNVQLEDQTLQQLKLLAVVEKKSVAAVMREAALAYLATKKDLKKKVAEIVYADDADVEVAMNESFKTLGGLYKKLAE
ncbi:MAG: hypothetical protein CVV27_00115 [Candidatus Melainabacteria bacterium HGW-Melainabacteria-1]|nr:MAG: hypothetical protein CVV27_00115 [Candidatus Melainabacteria bacterium HGW-Melainabacteria-1]